MWGCEILCCNGFLWRSRPFRGGLSLTNVHAAHRLWAWTEPALCVESLLLTAHIPCGFGMSVALWQLSECVQRVACCPHEGWMKISLFASVESSVCYQTLNLLKHLTRFRPGSADCVHYAFYSSLTSLYLRIVRFCWPGIAVYQYSKIFCNQFIINLQPLHVSSTTYSSSGGAAQTIGILRACYACWLLPGLIWNWLVPLQSW
jgi:hypothetical protein